MLRWGRKAGESRVRQAFLDVVDVLERGKSALVAAVPKGRAEPVPMGEALHAFEESLRLAATMMPAWRRAENEERWIACQRAVKESARMAEALRLEAPRLDFESMVFVIGDLMHPLEVFADAERELRGS